jgi:hypothetical protein
MISDEKPQHFSHICIQKFSVEKKKTEMVTQAKIKHRQNAYLKSKVLSC